jgi:membrane protein DedA with SNARE-associated domain
MESVGITESLVTFGTQVIGAVGYLGVFLLMVAESMVLPVPSEAVMPFAGFLAAEGSLDPVAVTAAALLGSIVGSIIGYAMGKYGGRPFLQRYGKWFLLDSEDLEASDRFFRKRGGVAVFVCRFIPVIRHLVSIPAGLSSMPLVPFVLVTTVGAGLWNTTLLASGYVLRRNWHLIAEHSHIVDIVVVVLLAAVVVLYVVRHLRARARRAGSR